MEFFKKNDTLTVALMAAALFIPFLGAVHLFDWDEINFAESAREMLITGEYFRVHINFEPFWEKPPLFFWLQAASMKLFGVNEFAARFPNAICGIITLTFIYHHTKHLFSKSVAKWWVLFMIGSFTPFLYFKSGIIDPWFNLFIFLTIFQLYKASVEWKLKPTYIRFLWVGVWCGLAVLTKGPVAALVVGLCVVVWNVAHRFKFFFSWQHVLITAVSFTAIASVWVVSEVAKNGFHIIGDFIAYQIDLFKNPVAGHGQPFWYHPVVVLVGCFPASLFAIKVLFSKAKETDTNQREWRIWMQILFWVVMILFSMVKTKIVHYSSLCYLPLTFCAAWGAYQTFTSQQKWGRGMFVPFVILGTILSIAFGGLSLIESFKNKLIPLIKDDFAVASLSIESPWKGYEFLLGFLFMAIVIYTIIKAIKGEGEKALVFQLSTTALFINLYMVLVVPKIEAYSQGPAVEFYQTLVGKDVYVESLGHKSYAQYFYAQTQPQINPKHNDMEWLKRGDIDKPAYFVVKVNHVKNYEADSLTEVGRKGGFALLMREPKK